MKRWKRTYQKETLPAKTGNTHAHGEKNEAVCRTGEEDLKYSLMKVLQAVQQTTHSQVSKEGNQEACVHVRGFFLPLFSFRPQLSSATVECKLTRVEGIEENNNNKKKQSNRKERK